MELRTVESLCAAVYSGGTPSRKKPEYYEGGTIPWIKTMEIRDGYIYDSEEKITESGLQNSSAKFVPKESVLIAMYGATVGRVGYLKIDSTTNQAACALVVNSEITNPKWLYYSILATRDSLIDKANGAAQQNISVSIVRNHQIKYVPLEEQERIAGILGSLDDKIEANTRLIQTMDSYKSTLFQAHICSESEGETIKVSDVATLIRENIAASDIDESMNYVALEHIPRHSLYSHEWTNSEGVMSNKSGFKVGDILFGKLRPYFHKVSIAAVDGIASTDILVLLPKPGFEVLAQSVLSSEDLIEYATQVSSGTRMPRASWKDIMNYEVTVKNVEILQESLSGFDAYSRALIHENKVLTETRDALIKRLID